MSFADELNAKTNEYHSKIEKKPTKDDFVNDRIQQYVVDIKEQAYFQWGRRVGFPCEILF